MLAPTDSCPTANGQIVDTLSLKPLSRIPAHSAAELWCGGVFIHTHAVLLWSQVQCGHLRQWGSRCWVRSPMLHARVSPSRIDQTGHGYVYNIEPNLAPTAARPRSASQSGAAPAVPLQSLRPLLILKRAGDGARTQKRCVSVGDGTR